MATPTPKKPRLDLGTISEELETWLVTEAKERGAKSKSALAIQILEAVMGSPEPLPELSENTPEPPAELRKEPEQDPDTLRKMAVTLDLLFKRYLADHPAMHRTEEEKEAVEERWNHVETIRRELLK